MGLFEGEEAKAEAIYELEHRWTKYRTGDVLMVVSEGLHSGLLVTVRFPLYFDIDEEQGYVVNEDMYPYKESELKFVRQNLRLESIKGEFY